MRRGRSRRDRSVRLRRVGTFLVTSVGLHHHLESEDKCCTEAPEEVPPWMCLRHLAIRVVMADPEGKEFCVLRPARRGRTDRRTRNLASSRSRSHVTQSTYRSRAAQVLGWGSGTRGLDQ
jgi:hypothetical protein